MPEGAASPEVMTPKLVSAPSWSIEIGSVNPRRTVRRAPQASERGPLFGGSPECGLPSWATDPNVATRPRRHPRCESGYLEERRRARIEIRLLEEGLAPPYPLPLAWLRRSD